MRAGYRVLAAVDKVQVRQWVFLRGNVLKCRAFWPADWRQFASSDTCVLTRNVTRSGSCSASADCSIKLTQLTVYALGKRPVAVGKGESLQSSASGRWPGCSHRIIFVCSWTANWACDREYSQAWHL